MVGIRDVARHAQVSPATVSRLLNDDKTLKVTPATRGRVMAAIKELDYQVKKKTKRNSSICIITPVSEEEEIDDPYFRSIRLGLMQEAKVIKIAANRIFRLSEQGELPEIEAFGAVIVLGHIAHAYLEQLYQMNQNIVIVDDPLAAAQYDCVYVDLLSATRAHLDRLYEAGHRNIAFIGGRRGTMDRDGTIEITEDDIRTVAYQEWMAEQGLQQYIHVYLGDWSPLDGMHLAEKLVAEQGAALPTALVAASDPLAVGIYRGLTKCGIEIPHQMAVVSFDNVEVSEYLSPPLSTADLKTSELGKAAIRLASEKIQEIRNYPVRLVIPAEIMVRDSE